MLKNFIGLVHHARVQLLVFCSLVVALDSLAAQELFALVGAHLRVVVAILPALLLEVEFTIAEVPVVGIAREDLDAVMPVVVLVTHTIVVAVLRVVGDQAVEVLVEVLSLKCAELAVEVVLQLPVLLLGLRVLRVAEFTVEILKVFQKVLDLPVAQLIALGASLVIVGRRHELRSAKSLGRGGRVEASRVSLSRLVGRVPYLMLILEIVSLVGSNIAVGYDIGDSTAPTGHRVVHQVVVALTAAHSGVCRITRPVAVARVGWQIT